MTYKGYEGYLPIVGHLAENGLVVGDEFREGNDSPGSRNLEFLKYCERQMPKGKEIKGFRSDSAAYQAKVINYCQENGIQYAIEELGIWANVRVLFRRIRQRGHNGRSMSGLDHE